jgi:hypothetical protein
MNGPRKHGGRCEDGAGRNGAKVCRRLWSRGWELNHEIFSSLIKKIRLKTFIAEIISSFFYWNDPLSDATMRQKERYYHCHFVYIFYIVDVDCWLEGIWRSGSYPNPQENFLRVHVNRGLLCWPPEEYRALPLSTYVSACTIMGVRYEEKDGLGEWGRAR